MKIEGLDEASIEDLEKLVDYHKKGIEYLIHEQKFNSHNYKPGLNMILNHEREILAIIEIELDKRHIVKMLAEAGISAYDREDFIVEKDPIDDLWNDGDTDPAGGSGPYSHV
jgi:hypothetical protein